MNNIFNLIKKEEEILILSRDFGSVYSFIDIKELEDPFPSRIDGKNFYYKILKLGQLVDRRLNEHLVYLKMASLKSDCSYCKRRQVGSIIVKDRNIISEGYNGTPPGFENICEDSNGDTHWYVQHAEANAILKVAKSNNSSENSVLYNTLCPCKDCSKMILGAGIKIVIFNEIYKTFEGIELLLNAGIDVYYIPKKLF